MNILFLADNFPPEKNAQASRVYERACHWVRWGHQVTVITCAPNFPEGRVYEGYANKWYQVEERGGIRVVRVKTFIAANAGTMKRVLDFLSYMVMAFFAGTFEPQPDVVVATSPQFFTAIAGWALSVVQRRPFVFELSDLWPDSIVAVGAMKQSPALRAIEKVELFLYRRAAKIVALTGGFKDNLVRRGISADKIAVVNNGVELSQFSPRPRKDELAEHWGVAADELVVGYIGTLGMAHGLDNVLRAAELVGEARVRFLMVGPGAERESLITEAQRRGLSNVTFVPPQPKDAIADFWSLCHVALVHLKDTPLFETVIPSKIFEAMGMGLPILLAAPAGEASKILLEEGAGIFIAPGDPQALAEAVLTLERDETQLCQFAKASFEAAPRHTRERQAEEMLVALKSACCLPMFADTRAIEIQEDTKGETQAVIDMPRSVRINSDANHAGMTAQAGSSK